MLTPHDRIVKTNYLLLSTMLRTSENLTLWKVVPHLHSEPEERLPGIIDICAP